MSARNLQIQDQRAAERAVFAASLTEAAGTPDIICYRVRCYIRGDRCHHQVLGYDAARQPVHLTAAQSTAVADLLFHRYPRILWTRDHDYHPAVGMLRQSPLAEEPGGIPSEDGTFGGSDPAFKAETTLIGASS